MANSFTGSAELLGAMNPRQNPSHMSEQMVIEPVILQGRHMRLEPLTLEHAAGLADVGLDDDLWKWIPTPVRTPEEMSAYVQTALQEQAAGSVLPFALIEKSSGRTIGSTRYANIERARSPHGVLQHRRLRMAGGKSAA